MATISLAPWQAASVFNPFDHFAMLGGVATGKSYTGSQFVIKMVREHPEMTGFIGANTYDQLTQASLRELFHWFNEYGIEYEIDRRPPASWGVPKKEFKDYNNILSVRSGGKVVTIFTRTLSDPDALRGIEFSWYWIDETRDTPMNTHDVLLSRMRETKNYAKGLVTTTTNGEDWAYQRFVLGNKGTKLYGSLHVPTLESVKAGIISHSYYDALRKSYSPLMAAQELDALHVNVFGGRAYYASGGVNRLIRAPWGDLHPNPDRPLILGCDFNFSPAPCIWMLGQQGPDEWHDHIHWFHELSRVETSTRDMTKLVIQQFPGFFYQVFGDASGNRGTTSNAGEHDYNQMAEEFQEAGCPYSISVEQANPLVKDRVENMNAMFKNALGEVRQTYNYLTCPNFDSDLRIVGWKLNTGTGAGRLSNGDDINRTHATDGAGYAVFKLFPPGKRARIIRGNASPLTSALRESI